MTSAMIRVRPVAAAALASLAVAAASVTPMAAADGTALECGLFRDYVAPDPSGPTDGSITFGFSGTPEVIAANATLVPPTDTALPSLQGGAPTCLTVVRAGGVITSLAFAPEGTVAGIPVLVPDLFGPGQDGYLVDDRLFVPVAQVAADPALDALFQTAFDSGTPFSVTFQIDVTTGLPTEFAAQTTLAGMVVILPGGDVQVGSATLPAAVIEPDELAALQAAADLGVTATVVVDGLGHPDQGGGVAIDITLTVSYQAPATATPTPSQSIGALPDTAVGSSTREITWAPIVAVLAASLTLLARSRARRRARPGKP